MSPISRMTDAELIEFATEFREGILDGRPSGLMCFAVCAPLVPLLRMCGVETELVETNFGWCNHVWLRLPDGRVLDPTADQFNDVLARPLPAVYLGKPVEIHANGSAPWTRRRALGDLFEE